jgi:hypothetical protein
MRRERWRRTKAVWAAPCWFLREVFSATAVARAYQLLQVLDGDRCWGMGARIDDGGEHRQHARIEAVGLGEDAVGAGEHAHPVRIDDGDSEAGVGETALERPVPFAGRLDGDRRGSRHFGGAREPALELADAGGRVDNAQMFVGGQDMSIQPTLADIDSDATIGCGLGFGQFLALHTGLAPFHLFRPQPKDARTLLTRSSRTQGYTVPPVRIRAGGHRPGCTAHSA